MLEEKLNLEELEEAAGGAKKKVDYIHDLNNFVARKVCNVIHYDATACLTLRRTPDGAIIPGVGWQNDEMILVHKEYREGGWYFAYDRKTKKYGYVNPNNVR
jgi:diadenosine tetraphosphatase ApaH/serine/threonine PP2A family protein phosphatase